MGAEASAWDRLQAEWNALAGSTPSRTAPYDELLAYRDEFSPPRDAYPAARLARDHARRVAYWSDRLGWGRAAARRAGTTRVRAPGAVVQGGIVGSLLLTVLACWRGMGSLAGSLAPGLRVARVSGRPALDEALARGLCPDCGYDLGGLPPALPARVLAGVNVGPASCPECGGRWPCVPPPAPSAKDDGHGG